MENKNNTPIPLLMNIFTEIFSDKVKALLIFMLIVLISHQTHAQVVNTWGLLSGTVPENNFQTSSFSAVGDGSTFVTVDINRSPSTTVGGAVNAIPPGLIFASSFDNTRATVGVSGNTYTYTFSEPVHVILSSQEHSELIRTENIKISSADVGAQFSGSLTSGQAGHFIANNNTSEIHIGSNASITTAGTYWTVQSNIAVTTLSVEYYVTDPTEAASGEPFTMSLAPAPFVRLDNDNSTGAGGIDFSGIACTSGTEILDGSDLLINAPHGIQRVEINLINEQNIGEEELSVVLTLPNINITGNGSTSVVVVNGDPSPNDFNDFDDIIDELYYKNTSSSPDLATTRQIEIVMFDEYGGVSVTSTIDFTLVQTPNSGNVTGPLVVFSTDPPIDLNTALDGSQDVGTWVDVDGTGELAGSTVNVPALGIGSYVFRYDVTGTSPCNNAFTSVVLIVLDGNELEMTSPSSCAYIMTEYTDPLDSQGTDDPIYIFDLPGNNGELSCETAIGATYDWYIFNPATNSYDVFALNSAPVQTGLSDGGYLVVRNDGGVKTEGRAWVWNSSLDADAGIDLSICNGDSATILGAGTVLNPTYTYYDPVKRPFIVDASTTITVTFDGTHSYISDLAFFMVSPDETQTVTLGENTQGFACNQGDDIVNLNFTNDTSIGTQVYDLCQFNNPAVGGTPPGGPLTGTWNAYYEDYQLNGAGTNFEGINQQNIDFTPFVGFDAGQGGWKVQIYDCENLDFGVLTGAIISFDDGAGDIRTYTSGSISVPINDNSCDAASASIYEVPFNSAISQTDTSISINPAIGIDVRSIGGYEWSFSTVSSTGPWSGPFENISTTPTVSPGTTTWYRIVMDNGLGCSAEDVMRLTVTNEPEPGIQTDEYACAGDAVVDLNALIAGADAGGVWSISGTSPNAPGGDFNAGAGTYDPTTGGVYIFDYTISAVAPCVTNGVSSVTVSVQSAPNTGVNNTIFADGSSGIVTLFNELLGTPDTGGLWSLDGAGDNPGANFDSGFGTLDSSGLTDGTYIFEYTLTNCATAMSSVTVIFSAADTDMDGVGDAVDLDDDNDGILDTAENSLGVDPSADADMDGIPNYEDFDNNGSATAPVCLDGDLNGICDTLDPIFDFDGDGVPNHHDLDSDNDGIYDVIETGGTPSSVNPGQANDTDGDATNNNGVPNSANGGAGIAVPTNTDSSGDPDHLSLDSDGDGCNDVLESGFTDGDTNGLLGSGTFGAGLTVDGNGVVTSGTDGYTDPTDGDTDGTDDYQQIDGPDADNDGVSDACDLTFDNNDNDSVGDVLDLDDDNDGIPDTAENSLGVDPSADADADGVPNYQDFDNNGSATAPVCLDADLNGICDTLDPVFDFDGDGIPNHFDLDSDNDGIVDVIEAGGIDVNQDGQNDTVADVDNDGIPDSVDVNVTGGVDIDLDGIDDAFDIDFAGTTDSDGDGIEDSSDPDADGDGLADDVDTIDSGSGAGEVTTGTGLPVPNSDSNLGDGPNFLDIDADDDGIVDNIEGQSTAGYFPPAGNDTDGDGIDDQYDADCSVATCGLVGTPIIPENTDGLGDGADYIDLDADEDGESDTIEAYDTDDDGVADTVPANADADGDGLDDNFDADGTSTTDAGGPTNGGQTAGNPFPDTDSPGAEPDWRDPVVNDLEITKVDTYVDTNTNGIIDAGDTINYVFVVTNNGTADITNITVADPVVTVSGGPLATLIAGNSDNSTFTASYIIIAADITAGTFSNTATVSAEDLNGNTITSLSDDPDDASDTTDDDNDGNPDDPTVTDLRQGLLDITKTDTYVDTNGNGIIDAGDTINYVFTVSNTGN
ncbi:hypothetical protein, partial [uncultured Aquimarina sp.]|uniref:beta strand repeat-containing protein n=1 Tax=uncultured Aquimarina sp. TaxID=575652 RepID=UPI00260FFFEE